MVYKLHYFDIRFYAEPARLMLTAAGEKFEDITWSIKQWPDLKPKTPTGKAPWLEVDGHVIPESFAIYRFLANRFGFAGKDEFEKALIDSTADFARDGWVQARPYLHVRGGFISGDADKLITEHFWPAMEKTFPHLKKILDNSKSGFVAPSGLTWADLWIVETIIVYRDLHSDFTTKYPWTADYVQRVHSDPRIKDYVQSRRTVRPSYINEVKDYYY